MAIRTSRELMAWQPPVGWHELSGDQRHAYLERHGIRIPLRPADWDTMEDAQRARYLTWHGRILHDTPEARAYKEREYRKDLKAWNLLMCWWCFSLLAALGIVWGTGVLEGAGLRIGVTVFAVAGFTFAIVVPMQITRPTRPEE
ncbi:hypothetical protein [Streptomyces sp. NPDC001068]|uniref:hypothetical protein n=1 Tax=Streptomyces sp. NPDC001068 TaxID=3364544 RepID=UPI0036A79F23